ncbi:DMT family transporter [Fertoebacter nigrum]|uniref:DMT family transporter n=1 Tax=Fertoeibacter niger TaxID=2656921 RepID=A0A8X8H2E1_9RHOB|nr:DMT family transporter [Fertoeibacter niger]NUB46016.1 DMT family transporter [Fertoeibacter niger]
MPIQNNRLGIALMIATVLAYTVQDGFTRHLAGEYNVLMVVMIRYWFFAAFVLLLASRRPEGFRAAVTTRRPLLHLSRSLLHTGEICVIVASFTLIGLINTHAVFAVCPLIIAALSGPVLREKVGLARWIAIAVGFAGIMVILQPGSDLFNLLSILPLASAAMFALYSLLTRLATQAEPGFIAFFWSGILGAVLMTLAGAWFWEPMTAQDWGWTALNGGLAILSNWLMIRCYAVAEASAVQPFAYLQLVFIAIMGTLVFDETLTTATVIGAAIVTGAGLFTLLATRRKPAEIAV